MIFSIFGIKYVYLPLVSPPRKQENYTENFLAVQGYEHWLLLEAQSAQSAQSAQ